MADPVNEREDEMRFIQDVMKEAAYLLDIEPGDMHTAALPAAVFDVILQARADGENAHDVARQLVDDEVIR